MGKKLWNNPKLGTSGLSCNSCHSNGMQLNLDKVGSFPHYVAMPHDVVTLDQMVNYCMLNPMKAKPLPWESREMTAMAALLSASGQEVQEGGDEPVCSQPVFDEEPLRGQIRVRRKTRAPERNPCRGR